jgi:hypothetical protein
MLKVSPGRADWVEVRRRRALLAGLTLITLVASLAFAIVHQDRGSRPASVVPTEIEPSTTYCIESNGGRAQLRLVVRRGEDDPRQLSLASPSGSKVRGSTAVAPGRRSGPQRQTRPTEPCGLAHSYVGHDGRYWARKGLQMRDCAGYVRHRSSTSSHTSRASKPSGASKTRRTTSCGATVRGCQRIICP